MRLPKSLDFYQSPVKVFLVFALVFGIIFIFLTPPYQGSDEDNHFYRAYQVSELEFRGAKTPVGPGGMLPKSLLDTKNSFDYLAQDPTHKINIAAMKAGFSQPLNSQDKIPISFPNTVLYSPLPYAPQAIGIGIVRHFEPSPLVLIYVARIFTFAVWVLLIYAAIRITPLGKWAFCILALTPMSLFTGATLSADAFINGLSFLAVALFFRYAMTKDPLVKKDYSVLLSVAVGLALCKPPYFLLASLYLFLPIAKFGSKRSYWLFAGSLVLALGITLAVWAALTKGLYVNYRITYDLANGQLIHAHQQVAFIIRKPFTYLVTLYNTYLTTGGDARTVGYIGMLGWLTFPPLWSVILDYGLIAFALGWLHEKPERGLIPLANWRKLLIATIGIGTVIAISTLEYVSYTPVGRASIDGIQGRYFIPLSVLLVAFFTLKRKRSNPEYQKICLWVTLSLATVFVSAVITVFFRYYRPSR